MSDEYCREYDEDDYGGYEAQQDLDNALDEMIDECEEYKGFAFNEVAINDAIQNKFDEIRELGMKNTICRIHPRINFYYNSLNICLGKQGSGKTTLLFRELIKLDTLPDQGKYSLIVYVTNGEVQDETFKSLMPLVTHIPIRMCQFDCVLEQLQAYFNSRDTDSQDHVFLILEDATFLLMKDNSQWCSWLTRLRHLRMTVWINLHVWRSITTQIKTQVTSVFVAPGFNRQQMQTIYRQNAIANLDSRSFVAVYMTLHQREWLLIDNVKALAKKL